MRWNENQQRLSHTYTEPQGLLQHLKTKYFHHLQKDMDAIFVCIHVFFAL